PGPPAPSPVPPDRRRPRGGRRARRGPRPAVAGRPPRTAGCLVTDRLLALAVRLLPPARRDWGHAMLAESAAIDSAPERRRHVLGCLRVVLAQPPALRAIGYPLLGLALLAGVL